MIQVFQPTIGPNERQAVLDVLDSAWLGRGPVTAIFERAFAEHLHVSPSHVAGVSCATEGLFQIFERLDLPSHAASYATGNVVMPAIHFIGAGNAVRARGLSLRLCEVDRHTLNATPASIAEAMDDQTVAILLLHYGGVPCDMAEIVRIARDRQVWLIEDAACSPASTYRGQVCGTFGDFGVWSFDAMKIITSGDGGMVYGRREEDITALRWHTYLGQIEQSGLSGAHEHDRWWEFQVESFGRRAILNDVQSALGLAQLRRLPEFVEHRRGLWEAYQERLAGLDWLRTPPPAPPDRTSSYYFYWIQTDRRDKLARYLHTRGIYTTFRYHPLHRAYSGPQRTLRSLGSPYSMDVHLPDTDWAADHTLLLPLHCGLFDQDVDFICDTIRNFQP